MKAWYFSNEDCRLRHGDNRKIIVGQTHKFEGEPIMCEQGLHASRNILDALDYAPGYIVWRVKLGGVIVRGNDKCVATERTYLAKVDATPILMKFARMCALDVVHLWNAPDVVIEFLKTGREDLRDAARAAAWDVVVDSRDAASDARDAAWAAAWYVGDAAGAARSARDAAWYVGDAARKKQSTRLYRMVMDELKRSKT